MTVYLRRRPLSLLLVVHANIPLRLPLRNAIRQSTIHRRSIAASAPLLPAKATEGAGALLLLRPEYCTIAAAVVPLRNAIRQSIVHRRSIAAIAPLLLARATEGAGALLLLRPQYCTVAAALVSHERFRTITMTPASVLLYKCPLLKKKGTNLPCAMSREGPVHLPQHLQYIGSCSPILPLSLLCSPCSLLLLHGFRRCCTERACKPSTQRYHVSGSRASDQTLTP